MGVFFLLWFKGMVDTEEWCSSRPCSVILETFKGGVGPCIYDMMTI